MSCSMALARTAATLTGNPAARARWASSVAIWATMREWARILSSMPYLSQRAMQAAASGMLPCVGDSRAGSGRQASGCTRGHSPFSGVPMTGVDVVKMDMVAVCHRPGGKAT